MWDRLRRHSSSRATARGIACAAVISSLVLVAPRNASARHGAAPFVDSGTVTLVADDLASDIDPASNESEFGDTVERNIDETLLTLSGSSITHFAPGLATSWSSNADKSTWVVHLRHGVRFHTGRCCLTAQDVRYSLARSVAAGLSGSYMLGRFLSKPLKQIKALDTYTVEFDLGRPQPFFAAALAQQYNAFILDSHALQAHATKGDPWAHNWATDHDLGTGPYTLQSWVRGQQVVLTRFPQYWGGWSGPHFSKVVLRLVPDSTTRRELMERSQADITFDLTPQDDNALKANPKVRVIAPYGTEIIYIVMTQAGPLASPYARQALSYAFPYDAVIQGVYRGYAKRAYGCLASTLLGYDPRMFHYQTDLAKAKKLLQKAGVKSGTTLTYTYNDPYGPEGELLQAQLAQLGITLKLVHLDSAAWSNIFYGTEPANQRPNLMPWSWWPDYNDPYDECDTLLASNQAPPNGNNGGMYHDARVDALLAAMNNADRATVVRDAREVQDLSGRVDPAAIWALEPAQATALARNLQGYIFNPIELRTYYFYTMYRS